MKMSIPFLTFVVGTTLCFAAAGPACGQDKTPAPALLAKAKITHEQAQKIALDAVPNATIRSSELEEEDGGLRWSFDLTTPGSKKTTEVGVDALTGKIVENKVESEKDEKKEGKDEKEEHHHKKD